MFRSGVAHNFLLRVGLIATLCTALLLPSVPSSISDAAPVQAAQRAARARPEKPEGVWPDLAEIKKESYTTREPAPPISSTVRSPKLPLQPWNGRRVGDPETPGASGQGTLGGDVPSPRQSLAMRARNHRTRRAHAAARTAAPPTVLDDQFIANFFNWAVVRAPNGNEPTYWKDQLRVAYAQGQTHR